jgi:hypothetical protein
MKLSPKLVLRDNQLVFFANQPIFLSKESVDQLKL